MNLSNHPLRRLAAQTLHIPRQSQRFISGAPEATTANLSKLLPVQLQYGKPNRPTPPSTHKLLDEIHANIPKYPHPRKYWYKQANLGLYGNLSIRHGKQVSEKNKHRSPRLWRPNIHYKRLWSECLNRFVRVKIATRIIRTIDKAGGLDSYLMGNRKGRIRELGMAGWALRWRVLRTVRGRELAMQERRAMGLEGQPMWMSLPFASKWLAAQEQKMAADAAAVGMVSALPATEIAGPTPTSRDAFSAVSLDEAAALELERQIDEEFDLDDEAAARGEDGGIELEGEADGRKDKTRRL